MPLIIESMLIYVRGRDLKAHGKYTFSSIVYLRSTLYGVHPPCRDSFSSCLSSVAHSFFSLGAVFPHRYHRTFVTILHAMLPISFPEGLRDLLTHTLTNTPLPLAEGAASLPDYCTFPHPNLAHLSLQHPNPVVTAGPPSPYATVLGALDILGFLDRYESQLTTCIYSLIENRVQETCPGAWGVQILPDLRNWLNEQVVPGMARPYARGLANRMSPSHTHCTDRRISFSNQSAEEARLVVAGVITRFEYHLCRTLCALRCVLMVPSLPPL